MFHQPTETCKCYRSAAAGNFKYESGLIFPQPQKLVAICLCLQTSADYLIGLSDDPKGSSSINSNFIQSVYNLDECFSYNP